MQNSTNVSSLNYTGKNLSRNKQPFMELDPVSPLKLETPTDEIYNFLLSLKEFSKIDPKNLKNLSLYCRHSILEPGQFINIEGDEESLYGFIIVSGCVAMTKTSVNGKELIVELLQSGDSFGLLLMLADKREPYQLSARALKHSKILRLPIDNFMQLLATHPILFKEYMAHLLVCLHSSYRLSRGLAHDQVNVRIAAILSSLSMKFINTDKNKLPTIHFTRQQLADLTGTTAETAIRVTREMQSQGLIEIVKPGVISILNLNAIDQIAEG